MVDAVLLVKRTDWFGSDHFASAGHNHFDRNKRINRLDSRLDHCAAVVLFGDDPISPPAVVCLHCPARPSLRRKPAGHVGQYISVTIAADAADDEPTFGGILG